MQLNFNQYIFDYYQPKLRNPKLVEFSQMLISPIIRQYDEFVKYYDDLKFIYSHTAQRKSVEHLLNNVIDIFSKPIKLIDGFTFSQYTIGKNVVKDNGNDTFDYNGQVITYKPLRPIIGKNVLNIPIETRLIISKGELIKDYYCDTVVLIGSSEFSDSKKMEQINYYLSLFIPAGVTYQLKEY